MKVNRGAVIWIMVFVVSGLLHCPIFDILFDDKELFKYMGMAVAKGQVPYRDFFDHKPPLIYFLNALGYLLGKWGLWIIDMTLVGFVSFLLYKLGRQYKLSNAWILPALFNILLRDWHVSMGIGMTRSYTAIIAIVFFYIALNQPRYKYYWLGILTALTFFMQQDQVFVLVPLYVWALVADCKTKDLLPKILLLTSAGFLSITTIIIGYFAVNHSLNYFWEDAFLFNFTWYSDKQPLATNIKTIFRVLHDTVFEMPLFVIIIAGVGTLIFQKGNRGLLMVTLIALLATFAPQILSSRSGEFHLRYYLQPFAATLCLVLFVLFTTPSPINANNKNGQLILAIMIIIMPVMNVGKYLQIIPGIKQSVYYRENNYRFLEKADLKDYDLFVAFNSNYTFLYNRFRVLAPTKRIYHFFWSWFPSWDKDHAIMNEMMSSMLKHKTRYILDFSEGKDVKLYSNAAAYWQSFLGAHYHKVSITLAGPKQTLWELNGVNILTPQSK